MTQVQFFMREVVVEVKAFAGFEHPVNVLGLAVAAQRIGRTVFRHFGCGLAVLSP